MRLDNEMQVKKYIPNDILKTFLKSFEKGDIWQVHQLNERRLIVFLYFDKQIEPNKNLLIYQKVKEEYFKLVKQYSDVQISSAK
jgi:hypothetical protein